MHPSWPSSVVGVAWPHYSDVAELLIEPPAPSSAAVAALVAAALGLEPAGAAVAGALVAGHAADPEEVAAVAGWESAAVAGRPVVEELESKAAVEDLAAAAAAASRSPVAAEAVLVEAAVSHFEHHACPEVVMRRAAAGQIAPIAPRCSLAVPGGLDALAGLGGSQKAAAVAPAEGSVAVHAASAVAYASAG